MRYTNLLTIVVSAAWVGSFVMKIFVPGFDVGPGADAAMLIVIGYWFSASALQKGDKK